MPLRHTTILSVLATVALPLIGTGCADKPPISTTLTDLVAESNEYKVDPMIDFHENVSINGLLLQPQVGAHWYTARPGMFDQWRGRQRSSPAFAIGISARLEEPTFCLSGETPAVDVTVVNDVKKNIEAIQARTVEATRITVDLAAARAALQKNEVDQRLAADERAAQKKELEARITELTTAKKDVDQKLNAELEIYRTNVATHPGLIVARWTVKNTSGASAKTSIFDVNSSSSDTTSGYLVLGGVRVSSLYFGDDLRVYVKMVLKEEQSFFDRLGITTYLIQTKALAYTNALDLQKALSASFSAKISSLGSIKDLLTDMDKITLAGYATTAMNLDNTGSLSGVHWYVRSRPMVHYDDAPDADVKRLPPASENAQWYRIRPTGTFQLQDNNGQTSPTAPPIAVPTTQKLVDDDWYTVVAVSADAPKVYEAFRKAAKAKTLPQIANVDERSFILLDRESYENRVHPKPPTSTPAVR